MYLYCNLFRLLNSVQCCNRICFFDTIIDNNNREEKILYSEEQKLQKQNLTTLKKK